MFSLPLKCRCFCGSIRFEMSAQQTFACHCHCESCRRASGAPFVTWVTFPLGSFSLSTGKPAEHRSSPDVVRGHCAKCGSSISYTHANRPDDIDITAACFEDPMIVVPQAHIWLEDKLPWLEINDQLPKYRQRVS